MKVCTVCKEEKELDAFYNMKASKDGKCYRCKVCDNTVRKESRSRCPVTQQGYHRRKLARQYGLDADWYAKTLALQEGKCAICGTTNPLGEGNTTEKLYFSFAVDHCHSSGQVRGLLCNACNRGIGFLQDKAEVLLKAAAYLQKFD